MTAGRVTIGIDIRSDTAFLAVLEGTAAPLKVRELVAMPVSELAAPYLEDAADLCLAVPDHLVLQRRVSLGSVPATVDDDDVVSYELAGTLLDDVTEFCHETIDQLGSGGRLRLLTRRQALQKHIVSLFHSDSNSLPPVRHTTRALALGKGYLTCCSRREDSILALVDFAGEFASIALVAESSVVDVAWLATRTLDLHEIGSVRQSAADLKTLLDFRLSSLPNVEPPATILHLLVTGRAPSLSMLTDLLRTEVSRPECIPDLLTARPQNTTIPAEEFLVALGTAFE